MVIQWDTWSLSPLIIQVESSVYTQWNSTTTRSRLQWLFTNPAGLNKAGDTMYSYSINSGDANIGESGDCWPWKD